MPAPKERIIGEVAAKGIEIVEDEKGQRRERKLFKDVEIQAGGNKIILPDGMETGQAITWLEKKRDQEEEMMGPNIPISCYPFDGLVAFGEALKEVFGYATYKPIRGFFSSTPPQFISVPISPTETVECPIGEIHIPGIDGHIMLEAGQQNNKPCLYITGKIKNKHFSKVKQLAEETKKIIGKKSIYRGKAIQLGSRPDERQINRQGVKESAKQNLDRTPPIFLRVTTLDDHHLVLPDIIQHQVKSLLWTPLEKTDTCRSANVPLKRGVLLSGPYGTGKSLAATITMKKAVENGWTFISLADPDLLTVAIDMATWYQPAVIFSEDIDQVIGTSERTPDVNAILNVVDGIDKQKEIIVVLTTNHVEKINRAMLRPGRLDAIIAFEPPDVEAAEKLLRLYAVTENGTKLIADSEDITEASEIMAGAPASMVREVVERAKLSSIGRSNQASEIVNTDLVVAATNIQGHLKLLMEPVQSGIHPEAEILGKSLASGLLEGIQSRAVFNESVKRSISDRVDSKVAAVSHEAEAANDDDEEEEN